MSSQAPHRVTWRRPGCLLLVVFAVVAFALTRVLADFLAPRAFNEPPRLWMLIPFALLVGVQAAAFSALTRKRQPLCRHCGVATDPQFRICRHCRRAK